MNQTIVYNIALERYAVINKGLKETKFLTLMN